MNAIVGLAESLSLIQPHPALLFIADAVGEDATGEALFGKLQMNKWDLPSTLRPLVIDQEQSEIGVDIRIPVLVDKENLVARLQRNCG